MMMHSATFKGFMLSLAACEIKIGGKQVVGLTKADMSCGVTREVEYGSGPIGLGVAIGQHKASFTCDQHAQEAFALMAMLDALAGGAGFSMAKVNVTFTFTGAGATVAGIGAPVRAVILTDVTFNEWKKSPTNDGKSVVGTWTCTVVSPIGWDVGGGKMIYSINPDVFAQSNSLTVGVGGTVSLGG